MSVEPPVVVRGDKRENVSFAVAGVVRSTLGSRAGLLIGCVIVATVTLLAVLAPLISPADPTRQDLQHVLAPPGADHLLGTDQLGRDVLSRLLYGARTDLFVAAVAVLISLCIGTALGAVTGYFGGPIDTALMRLIDVVIAFPVLVLLIALVFVLGAGIGTMILAIVVVDWVAYARLVRVGVRSEREKEYVMAAQIGGLSHARILCRHILPNVAGQSVVFAMSDAVLAILAIATLGFLGVGIPPPAPDWGGMIADAQPYVDQWWLTIFPGAAIFVTALGLSLIGDGLAEKWSEQ